MRPKIKLADCLWLVGEYSTGALFQPFAKGLELRGVRGRTLPARSDAAGWRALKEQLWKTDRHVMLQGMNTGECKRLYPLFKERRNFSILTPDWWIYPFWFMRNAEYAVFPLYSGIAIRTQSVHFANDWQPPLLTALEGRTPYAIACTALRPAALLAQPFLDLRSRFRRAADVIRPERLIYYPFPVSEELLPLREEKPQYDFCNTGSTVGYWLIRDPYASAKYSFANLYGDRKRLVDLILKLEGRPYKIFDRRRFHDFVPWETYCQSIRRSRFAITTGGIHQASVPKYLENACLGTPMIGSTLPYEFPWLDKCVFPIDGLRVTPDELEQKLKEALEMQPKLRQNCLELRDTILRLYDPVRLFDMAQDQIDGQPIPPGYLRE